VIRRLRSSSGGASVEYAGTVTWVLLAALVAWQLALTGWTAVSATNAARTASRAASRGLSQQDAETAGRNALWTRGLGPHATVRVAEGTSDDVATVTVLIPIVVPGFKAFQSSIPITEHATLPHTG